MTLLEAFKLALQHYQAGRLPEAAEVCRAILAAAPDQPETHQLFGVIEYAAGRLGTAARYLRSGIMLRPDFAEGYTNLGVVRQGELRTAEAITLQDRAIRLNPNAAEAFVNRGTALLSLGDRNAAAADFARATALKPDAAQPVNNLGVALREQRRLGEAASAHRRAIALDPAFAEAYRNLGHALREAGGLSAAGTAYVRAYALDPSKTDTLSYHLFVKQAVCDWSGYDALCREVADIIDSDRGIVLPLANLSIETTAAQQYRSARHFFRTMVRPTGAPLQVRPRVRTGDAAKLRIAYFSADFHEHATAYLAAEMFELHDRGRFQIHAYSYGPDDGSPMRRRLIDAFDTFRDVRSVGLDAVADAVTADGIDILVDLKGYTKHSRLDLLSRRLAPVQAEYLGYPGTVGSDLMDYVIADGFITPPEHQPFYTERLVLMPDTYQINDRHRPIAERVPSRAECGLPENAFVFCSFNTTYKLTPVIFALWMRLLAQVPGSVLWLFEANRDALDNLRRTAAAHGIDPERLVFAPKRPLPEHLVRYRVADLFVDTLPYTGHTTTSDALWAGLPVVTCAGGTFASRVAGSLLRAAGVPELVTGSLAEYEALALKLARDPALLAGFRRRLTDTRMTVPLFDSKRFTRHLERAYEIMWEIHAAGQPPRGFAVPPLPPGTPD